MRLAIIVDTFPSLSETFISEKVKQLAKRGCEVRVFCSRFNQSSFTNIFESNQCLSVCVFKKTSVFYSSFREPLMFLKSLFSARVTKNIFRRYRVQEISTFKPDIIHFEFSGIGIDYMEDFQFLPGQKVVSCRGSAEKVKLLIYADRKKQFAALLKKVDAVHCVSEDMVRTILPYCSDASKVFVNYPSIDTGFFSTKESARKTRHVMILSVGRMTFQKGYAQGLITMQLLKQKGCLFTWLIVGEGICKEEILFKTKQLGLTNEVVFAGSKTREEVKDLMKTADIYYLPSVYEGIANVVLEAMSMQLPVVSTNSGGMSEVIENARNGFIANVHNYTQQADYLFALCKSFELRQAIGIEARKRIERYFTIEMQTSKYYTQYNSIVNAARGAV